MSPGAGNRSVLLVSRMMVVLLGLWALYQAMHTEKVLQKALYAYTIYSTAVTPVVLAAFFSRRATAQGAVACIAAGTLVTLTWDSNFIQSHLPSILVGRAAILPALVISIAFLVIVSCFTPPPRAEQLQPFHAD